MSTVTTATFSDNKDNLSKITTDLESASLTVQTLIDLAQRAIASEEPGSETLIQAAARYAADLPAIVQRLLAISQRQQIPESTRPPAPASRGMS